jgi:ribosomal protein L39E
MLPSLTLTRGKASTGPLSVLVSMIRIKATQMTRQIEARQQKLARLECQTNRRVPLAVAMRSHVRIISGSLNFY